MYLQLTLGLIFMLSFHQVLEIKGSTTLPVTHETETTATASVSETTASPPSIETTSSPIETTANPVPRNKYTVSNENGTICIVLKAEITFHIPYNTTDGSKVANISIPNNFSTSGNCRYKDNEQLLTIKFFNETWTLSLTIANENQGAENQGTESTPYSWKDIGFACVLEEELFPDILPEQKGSKVVNDVWYVSGVFHTQGTSYKCEETETLDLSDGLEMDVSNLQYRAFGTTVNDTFSNAGGNDPRVNLDRNNACSITHYYSVNRSDCTVRQPTYMYANENYVTDCAVSPEPNTSYDKTPAIVIGGVCGGLVVICLVVYIIFRRREHNNYQPM